MNINEIKSHIENQVNQLNSAGLPDKKLKEVTNIITGVGLYEIPDFEAAGGSDAAWLKRIEDEVLEHDVWVQQWIAKFGAHE